MNDYKEREYLPAIEVAKYLGISAYDVHKLLKTGKLKGYKATKKAKSQVHFSKNFFFSELVRMGFIINPQ